MAQITISGNISGNAVIEIYAINGALVYQMDVTDILPGNTTVSIDVSNIENGNYVGVIKNNNTRSSGFVITIAH